MRALDARAFGNVQKHIANADILTFRDTVDMPEYLRQCPRRASESMLYWRRMAFLWRSFSNPILWQALLDYGAVTPAKEPDWKKLETVLRRFIENGLPVGGGMCRTTTLKNTVCIIAPNGDWHLPRAQPNPRSWMHRAGH